MAKFIELHFNCEGLPNRLINIDSISYIECWADESVSIHLIGTNEVLLPRETYREIERKIKDFVL